MCSKRQWATSLAMYRNRQCENENLIQIVCNWRLQHELLKSRTTREAFRDPPHRQQGLQSSRSPGSTGRLLRWSFGLPNGTFSASAFRSQYMTARNKCQKHTRHRHSRAPPQRYHHLPLDHPRPQPALALHLGRYYKRGIVSISIPVRGWCMPNGLTCLRCWDRLPQPLPHEGWPHPQLRAYC